MYEHNGHDLPARLLQVLAPWRNAPVWHVGFSGGLDSTVLLHLLAELSAQESLPPLNAIHIHHGLQDVADTWPDHCRRVCQTLGVPFQSIAVQVKPGASLEQAAREARYGAFTQLLGEGDLLLTAQHRDDQAETLLFRLLRGAGVRGLAAMPLHRSIGKGQLLRPLLSVSRAELEDYARLHGLSWIEDPSNADQQLSRNFLRGQVMPLLSSRWPQVSASMARTAEHMGEAEQLLSELAEQDLASAKSVSDFTWLGMPVLALAPLAGLSGARQRNALRHWLAPLTRLPDTDHWAGWEALLNAGEDARPLWRLADGELHRSQGHIWWLSGSWLQSPGPVPCWPDASSVLNLPGNGRLAIEGVIPSGQWQVRYRQGGEVMQIERRGHRDLKRLLNECGVPSFVRGRLPLLYRDNELVAVAGLPGLSGSSHGNWHLNWIVPTSDQCLS